VEARQNFINGALLVSLSLISGSSLLLSRIGLSLIDSWLFGLVNSDGFASGFNSISYSVLLVRGTGRLTISGICLALIRLVEVLLRLVFFGFAVT
jgi:hypothetical protein